MSEAHWTGPIITTGSMMGIAGANDANFKQGPNISFQGESIPDPRLPILGADYRLGSIRGFYSTPYITTLNTIPAASAATPVNLAAAANTVSGTAMTLAAASPGVSVNIPFYPLTALNSGTPLLSGATLDYGFDKIAVTAGSTIATPVNINSYWPGQQIVIAGGGAGGTAVFITFVNSVGLSTITLRSAPLFTQAAAPVGATNILSPTSGFLGVAWSPYYTAGALGALNPAELSGRGVGITCSATGGGGTFLVRGYDIYGVPMSETITHPGGAVTAYGRKAFKHIMSVTPGFTDATRTYSVGTSDVLGFALRSDLFEENEIYAGGAFIVANTGFTPADPSIATSVTGDVRGTAQIGTRGPLGTGVGATSLNGTLRVKLAVMPSLFNMIQSTPALSVAMFGQTQA